MGIFTKDKKEETEKEAVKAVVKAEPAKIKDNTGRAHRVLRNYHLSEKSNAFSQDGRYVFVVDKSTNKIEVKKAVESVYDVHVASVNMVNVLGKKRRQGRSIGRTQNWKKAVVTLKNGERIKSLAEGV
jgi:large subunit ribosomal protein L23